MSAQDFTEEESEAIVGELLLEANEAREDEVAFFEFVLRDEVQNLPIKVAPHQQLALEFIHAHRRCVVMLPFGSGKTYTISGDALFRLGDDPLMRGAVCSVAQAQAEKPVSMIRQYIEASAELQLVFPNLRPTQRRGEPWTTTDLTLDRPPGIRDPSLVARGLDSRAVLGSRWKWLLCDDMLNEENTRTPEQREKVWSSIQKTFFTRLDPASGRCVWCCTAWHPDDVTHRLMKPKHEGGPGWPALVMRADGVILLLNTEQVDPVTKEVTGYWDSDLIRPADDKPAGDPTAEYRLVQHDPDPEGKVPLWPERWSAEALQEQREELHPAVYNQLFLNICRDDSSALCKEEYLKKALEVGRRIGWRHMVEQVDRTRFPHPIFVGVDLAFSKEAKSDECAIFVLAAIPDPDQVRAGQILPGKKPAPIRLPLWIEAGRWGTAELYDRLVSIDRRFGPWAFAFENNGAQEGVRQLMVAGDKSLVLKPHTTDATKNSIAMGVPSIFAEMANGLWAFPNDNGRVNGALRKFMDQCLAYVPGDHTGDVCMAGYFARSLAKKWGVLARADGDGGGKKGPGIASRVMAR